MKEKWNGERARIYLICDGGFEVGEVVIGGGGVKRSGGH